MKNYILILMLFTLFGSCIKTLDLEEKNKSSKLVVNSLFTPNSDWIVRVTRSLSVLDRGELSEVKNATVRILDENNVFIVLLAYNNNGYYFSTLNLPIIGKRYKIEVSASGFKTVTSENYCPQKPIITSISGVDKRGIDGRDIRSVKLKIQDKINEKNFYGFNMNFIEYSIDTNLSTGGYDTNYISTYTSFLNSNHPYVDPVEDESSNPFITLSDNLFDGKTQEITFYDNLFVNNPNNYFVNSVNVTALSEESYKYIKSYRAYLLTEDNPFAEPVQVFSNINNGFGIFGGKSSQIFTFTIN